MLGMHLITDSNSAMNLISILQFQRSF